MTTIKPGAGTAELLLICDFPVEESHLSLVRGLLGERTSEAELNFFSGGRVVRWPLRVTYEPAAVDSVSFHLSLCAGLLVRRRATVERLRALGCNLELCVRMPPHGVEVSLAAATMKHLSDLHVQLSLLPAGVEV